MLRKCLLYDPRRMKLYSMFSPIVAVSTICDILIIEEGEENELHLRVYLAFISVFLFPLLVFFFLLFSILSFVSY